MVVMTGVTEVKLCRCSPVTPLRPLPPLDAEEEEEEDPTVEVRRERGGGSVLEKGVEWIGLVLPVRMDMSASTPVMKECVSGSGV